MANGHTWLSSAGTIISIAGTLIGVGIWVASIEYRLSNIQEGPEGPQGKDGPQGPPGISPTVEEISDFLLDQHLDELRGPRGEKGLDGPPGPTGSFELPEGAVVAFASLSCPVGWAYYGAAGGRVVVGAGAHNNRDEDGYLLPVYNIVQGLSGPQIDHGGQQYDIISVEHLPPTAFVRDDDARSFVIGYSDGENEPEGDPSAVRYFAGPTLGETERGVGQKNIPPYIALYWCTPENID